MMQAKIIDRKWVVEWFDERQCYHMPSLTLADNGNPVSYTHLTMPTN